jgi:hypothetical protein
VDISDKVSGVRLLLAEPSGTLSDSASFAGTLGPSRFLKAANLPKPPAESSAPSFLELFGKF